MSVFVPHKIICWNLTPNMRVLGDKVSGRWSGHEGGVLMNGICIFVKENPVSFLTLSAMWGHSGNMAFYEPGSGHSPIMESVSILILRFPDSRTLRNKFLLFMIFWLHMVFSYSGPNELRCWVSWSVYKLFQVQTVFHILTSIWYC